MQNNFNGKEKEEPRKLTELEIEEKEIYREALERVKKLRDLKKMQLSKGEDVECADHIYQTLNLFGKQV